MQNSGNNFQIIQDSDDARADVSDFTRWIKEANINGYQVIATCSAYNNGSQDPATLMNAANWWKKNYSALSTDSSFINLMNEWGDHYRVDDENTVDAQKYADAYNNAIPVIRETGYSGPIICDISGFGQETHIAAAASPLINDNNIIFSVHIYPSAYNYVTGNWMQVSDLDHLGNAGRPVIIGEFGSKASKGGKANWSAFVGNSNQKAGLLLDGPGMETIQKMNMISPFQ